VGKQPKERSEIEIHENVTRLNVTFTMAEETFTKRMRSATREIHAISDSLVNAKLAFGELLVVV
jgi:hypothetical protein